MKAPAPSKPDTCLSPETHTLEDRTASRTVPGISVRAGAGKGYTDTWEKKQMDEEDKLWK